MMGNVENNNIRDKIKLESSIYKDIVQEDFLDSYRNLTYKGSVLIEKNKHYLFMKFKNPKLKMIFTIIYTSAYNKKN